MTDKDKIKCNIIISLETAENDEIADAYAYVVSCGNCPFWHKCGNSEVCSEFILNILEKGDKTESEDAISRQGVINAINQNCIFENEYNLTASRIKNLVQQMPSLTPQQATCEEREKGDKQ